MNDDRLEQMHDELIMLLMEIRDLLKFHVCEHSYVSRYVKIDGVGVVPKQVCLRCNKIQGSTA